MRPFRKSLGYARTETVQSELPDRTVREWWPSPPHGEYDKKDGQNMIVSSSRTSTQRIRSSDKGLSPVVKFCITADAILSLEISPRCSARRCNGSKSWMRGWLLRIILPKILQNLPYSDVTYADFARYLKTRVSQKPKKGSSRFAFPFSRPKEMAERDDKFWNGDGSSTCPIQSMT